MIVGRGVPRIIDFGSAVQLGSACTERCGAMPFVAPEVFLCEAYDAAVADVFSMGALLLDLVCGRNALCGFVGWPTITRMEPGEERCRTIAEYLGQPKGFEEKLRAMSDGLTPELLECLRGALAVEPGRRLSSRGLYDRLP